LDERFLPPKKRGSITLRTTKGKGSPYSEREGILQLLSTENQRSLTEGKGKRKKKRDPKCGAPEGVGWRALLSIAW